MEKSKNGAQKTPSVWQFLDEHRDLLRRQGWVQAAWRSYQGRRLGPFYRLRYREHGRQQAVYLGADAALAEEVRRALANLQAPDRARREIERQRALVLATVREHKRAFACELEAKGLRLHGNEIRGWRSLPGGAGPVVSQTEGSNP